MKWLNIFYRIVCCLVSVYRFFCQEKKKHDMPVPEYLSAEKNHPGISCIKLCGQTGYRQFFSNLAGNFILFIPYTFIMVIIVNYKNSRLVLLSVLLFKPFSRNFAICIPGGSSRHGRCIAEHRRGMGRYWVCMAYKNVDPCIIQPPIVK